MLSRTRLDPQALKEIRQRLPFLVGSLAISALLYLLGSLLRGKIRLLLLMFATLGFLVAVGLALQILWAVLGRYFKIDTNRVVIFAGALLGGLFALFLVVGLLDEVIKTYRGWTNDKGTQVDSYALYERNITSRRALQYLPPLLPREKLPEWEIVDVYRMLFLCDIDRYFKQQAWLNERQRKLDARLTNEPDSPLLFSADELPVSRYYCRPITMYYRPGQGWGIF
jgi:hypothetical protein